jgi:uncharacterized glyoxalase superfamily protein PhnB
MKHNRSVPPVTVCPVLTYPDVRAAVAWLSEAFGFVERTRIGDSHRAQLAVGDHGAVIVADEQGDRQPPQPGRVTHSVRVRVEDLTGLYERAVRLGATSVEPPTERPYGELECTIEDPAGHRWQFGETLRDVAPEEFGCTTVTPWTR